MLKGRMAETLVEELLRKSGNTIYRFGYEAILQNLTQIEKTFNGEGQTGERIRAIPDFVVLDKDGTPTFLEVKYRGNGQLHENDHKRLKRIKELWGAEILIVNCSRKPYYEISYPPYFDKDGNFRAQSLADQSSWKIDPELYVTYENLVEKYLSPTLLKKQILATDS